MNICRKFLVVIPGFLLLLLPVLVAGCGTAAPVELNVSAAASLTDALKAVNDQYMQNNQNITVTANFASSGTLQKQIEQGAPADVFVSAGAAQMDALQKEQLLADNTRRNLLNNQVVLILPSESTLDITSFKDLTGNVVTKIAIGDPQFVPAGTYAQQAFDLLGITAQIKSKLILASDVRQVLAYVESGNVEAGVVYATDAVISGKVKIVASAPPAINSKVVYPVVVIKASKNAAAAKAYIDYLFGAEAKMVFEKYGFVMAGQ
jgi:molybdate transport system substrate-binding protein